MLKLPPEFKAQWLEALRSGKYQQTRHYLHSKKGGFCCLGVACDMIGVKWSSPTTFDEDDDTEVEIETHYITKGGGSDELPSDKDLPKEVIDCLNQRDADRYKGSLMDYLANMNDNGETFTQIADWIEENL